MASRLFLLLALILSVCLGERLYEICEPFATDPDLQYGFDRFMMCSKVCKDNVNWVYSKGKKDKSIGKTAYMGWDVDRFIEKCVLRDTEYGGYNNTYPSELISDSFNLVNDGNIDVFEKTLGPAGETGYGVYDNKYVMYAALDMMSFVYRLKSPKKAVCVFRGYHL